MNKLEDSIKQALYQDATSVDSVERKSRYFEKAFCEIFPEYDSMNIRNENYSSIEVTQQIADMKSFIQCLFNDKHLDEIQISELFSKVSEELKGDILKQSFERQVITTNDNAHNIMKIQEYFQWSSVLLLYSDVERKLFCYDRFDSQEIKANKINQLVTLINQSGTNLGLFKDIDIQTLNFFIETLHQHFNSNQEFIWKFYEFMLHNEKYELEIINQNGETLHILSNRHLDFFNIELQEFVKSWISELKLRTKPQQRISKIIWEL